MRTLVLEIFAFAAGAVVAAILWHRRQQLLRAAAGACVLLLLTLGVQGLSGWPAYEARIAQLRVGDTTARQPAPAHHAIGHASVTVAVFVLPVLMAAALRHAGAWRRGLHLFLALLVTALWGFAAITGYLLPAELPPLRPEQTAATVLRFAVLHMIGVPAILLMLLVLVSWRHWRGKLQGR
jgi:hypothetical protein